MKRKLIILMALILLIASLGVGVSAEESEASGLVAQGEHPYADVVRKAIDQFNDCKENSRDYYDEYKGYGALYDLDGNGVQELLLLYPVIDTKSGYQCVAFSAYTTSNGKAVALISEKKLAYVSGGELGCLSVLRKDGIYYISLDNSEYGNGSFSGNDTLYRVNGTSIWVDTEIEYRFYDAGGGYAYVNNVRYSVDALLQWYDKFEDVLFICVPCYYEEDIVGAKSLTSLLNDVKKLPLANYNGLVQVDGVWGYYEGGVLQEDYTGLVPYEGKIFYVENGILTFTYTGLVYYQNEWRYVANSELTEGYTGLVYFNENWFYTVNSRIDWTFTGLVPYNGNYFYVQNNRLDWSYTGLGYHNGGWYYVENALLKPDYTGLAYFDGNWFYVENGRLTFHYTGLVYYEGNYFYVENSALNWSYTGLGYHNGGWYYIENALLKADYNGLVYFNNTWFYIENGQLTWTTNGLRRHEGKLYYITNSEVNWSYTGYALYNGSYYYVQNGVVHL